jgi:trans-2,3-dihydro-3-hydroxyanthranilate isomerase
MMSTNPQLVHFGQSVLNVRFPRSIEDRCMRKVPVYLYDAFSRHVFGGNVAGVVIDAGVDDTTMQSMAAEMPVATTGFVSRCADGSWDLRFFTPTQEIDMCGHVVVGTFSALADLDLIDAGAGARAVARTKAGPIAVLVRFRDGRPLIEMELRRPEFRAIALDRDELSAMLGLASEEMHPTLPLAIVSTAIAHLVVPVRDLAALKKLTPDASRLGRLSKALHVDTIPVIACDGLSAGISVRSRDLCPGIGNAEESASGTTNGALACYLHRNGRAPAAADGIVRLTAEQGVEMGRPSLIESELVIDSEGIAGVRVRGQAIRSFEGLAFVP